MTTPIHFKQDKTVVRASIGPGGKLTHHFPPVYHGDPINAGGVLCFNDFGWDLTGEMRRAGFVGPTANFFSSEDYGYLGTQCVLLTSRQLVLANRSKRRTLIGPVKRPEITAQALSQSDHEGESTKSLLARAESLRKQSKWLEAGFIYRTLTRRLPNDLSVWRDRVECSAKLGHRVLTNLLIQSAIRNHPKPPRYIVASTVPAIR